ncbi:MAG: minimal chain-length factor beta [Streptomyces sp.]|jgi:act minimal PKS chain-length factor (CLF/KS beta)|nr:minimal chain-length factor beta [Streptomyces sp.]
MTAVVTGIGVVAPNGLGTEAYWQATLAGRSGIGPISRFDTDGFPLRLVGEIDGFTATDYLRQYRVGQTDRMTHLAVAATAMALQDAGLDPADVPEYGFAVATASSIGGAEFGHRAIERLWSEGPRKIGAFQAIAWFYAATTGQIAILHDMKGPGSVHAAEQAGGLEAIAQARRALRGGARAAITGGTEAPLDPGALVGQLPNGRLNLGDDPETAYAPFSATAAGHVPGEGGAILVVENGQAAYERGARVHGTIAGHAATFDPAQGLGRPPTLRRAIQLALDDAGLDPGEVDVVFADAAGTRTEDRAEAEALAEVFGPYGVPVTAPKSMTGRLYAGGAALDTATALLALRDQVIPPTTGVGRAAPDCPVDLVTGRPREARLRNALVVARGYGGFNAALVVRRITDRVG